MAQHNLTSSWWVFSSSIICIFLVSLSSSTSKAFGEVLPSIGINWEAISSHPIPPKTIVQVIKDNGFTKVKLYDSDSWTMSFLSDTGIEVIIAIPNQNLEKLSRHFDHAKEWVKHNVTKHLHFSGVNIKYIAVGNEPFLRYYNGMDYTNTTFPALQNIQKALDEAGFGDKIKATIPLSFDVYESTNGRPSGGEFREDIRDLMNQILKFLDSNKSPIIVSIHPFISLYKNLSTLPYDFAFFDNESSVKPIIDRNNATYTNFFDLNYDMVVWALKKSGFPDLKIIVGEVGWPTDGDTNANPKLATRFYNGFLKKLASNKGTPLKPGTTLDVYLYNLLDEDMKNVVDIGLYERHWGLLTYDGKPKFPIDLTGKEQNNYMVGAKGIQYLPQQWCVVEKTKLNMSLIPDEINFACWEGDCTSLGYGCNKLDVYGNISYAFNMYYQMQDQNPQACGFHGMAKLTKENASQGNCLFPIQIVSGGKRIEVMSLTCKMLLCLIVLVFLLKF